MKLTYNMYRSIIHVQRKGEYMINVYIDEFTPCLKDGKTGELVQTEVIRVRRKSFLNKYKPEENNMFFASTKATHCYSDVDYSKFDEVFVLYGKETKGLPEDLLQKYIENTIRIPMRNTLRSLNLSNSVAIITYEILRQINFDGLQETSEYFE